MEDLLFNKEAARIEALRQYQILDTTSEVAFDDLTRLAAQICKTPTAFITLLDANRQWFKSRVGADVTEAPLNVGFCPSVLKTRNMLLIPDTLAEQQFAVNPMVTANPYVRFYAGVPLTTAKGYILGTICVMDYLPRELSEEQIEALQALSRQVVTQLELRHSLIELARNSAERQGAAEALQQLNADLERQVLERTAQLQQSLDFEAMLKRITDKVRDSLDERQILQAAVQELALVLGIICCDAALYNLDKGTSTICYEHTVSSNEWARKTPSSIGRVVQIADFPEGYHQLLQGQYFQFCELTSDAVRGQVAILACPIVDDQGVLGDLWLFNYLESAFNELEIRLVQQVANQCAIAIRQAQLYQASRAQVQELEKLNFLKDDFLSTVSHELRTPIANMKMAIQMLLISPIAQQRARYLEILQESCTRESKLIDDLLDLQRLEFGSYSSSLIDEAFNLQEMLLSMIEPFRVRTQQREQTLQINLTPDLPELVSNHANVERILAELLNNACKYTPAGGEIVLSTCYKPIEAATIFTISNPVEIPAAELPRIFEKFYRVPKGDPWKQGGTGLGLALVKKLVERLQGTILVESSNGWTTFTVVLPNQAFSHTVEQQTTLSSKALPGKGCSFQ